MSTQNRRRTDATTRFTDLLIWLCIGAACGFCWREFVELIERVLS